MKKNTDTFWKHFAYAYFAINTVCIVILLEVIFAGKPFISLFLIIFAYTYYSNRKRFKKKPEKLPSYIS